MPYCATIITLLLMACVEAETRLARIFDNHMVLQRDEPVAIFGHDKPGEQIQVHFGDQKRTATTSKAGTWNVTLAPLEANPIGRTLTVIGSSRATVSNLLVGEVWLAAGQSNMNFTVDKCATKPHPEYFPLIRMANWEGRVSTSRHQIYGPQDFSNLNSTNHYTGTWQAMDHDSVLHQSGVGYFFANALARELKVPVGIVDISLGGTTTEAFIAPAVLRQNPYLEAAFEDPRNARSLGQWATARITTNLGGYSHHDQSLPFPHPFAPGFLHATSMPHIIPFTFKGVIWYQGESNAEFTSKGFRWNGERLADHQTMVMEALINSWRTDFRKPAMPFYMVELPRISAVNRTLWPSYREAQQRVARDNDGVELASIPEFGATDGNVHPSNKEPVGERLARIALAKAYDRSIAFSGPNFTEHQVVGDAIHLRFEHAGKALTDRDGGSLRNFEIAGSNRHFVPAEATIRGECIVVRSADVPEPVAVRHAWSMDIDVDLANSNGFTAPPFRTDSWLVAPGRRIRVACIGDSITLGTGLKEPARESYPVHLGLLLGDGFDVRGYAKSGFGIHRPAKRFDQTQEFREALAFKPDIVICNLGINDITQWGTYNRSDLVTEYRTLIDAFASLSTAPYIIQWSPLAPIFPGHNFHGDPNVKTLKEWIAYAASHTGVDTLDMFTPFYAHPEWFPDHIHPNATGTKAIAEEVFTYLQQLDQTAPSQ